jgi:hypothetical protein
MASGRLTSQQVSLLSAPETAHSKHQGIDRILLIKSTNSAEYPIAERQTIKSIE